MKRETRRLFASRGSAPPLWTEEPDLAGMTWATREYALKAKKIMKPLFEKGKLNQSVTKTPKSHKQFSPNTHANNYTRKQRNTIKQMKGKTNTKYS